MRVIGGACVTKSNKIGALQMFRSPEFLKELIFNISGVLDEIP
jgi:hypothetical protein